MLTETKRFKRWTLFWDEFLKDIVKKHPDAVIRGYTMASMKTALDKSFPKMLKV